MHLSHMMKIKHDSLELHVFAGGCVNVLIRRKDSADSKMSSQHEHTETDGGLSVCELREVSPLSRRESSEFLIKNSGSYLSSHIIRLQ